MFKKKNKKIDEVEQLKAELEKLKNSKGDVDELADSDEEQLPTGDSDEEEPEEDIEEQEEREEEELTSNMTYGNFNLTPEEMALAIRALANSEEHNLYQKNLVGMKIAEMINSYREQVLKQEKHGKKSK